MQSAYVPGRLISENICLVQEIVQAMKKKDDKFRQLISQCISTTQIEVMLNGSHITAFKPTRGIRQGDPLSPYVFILAMDSFSRFLAHCEATGKITGQLLNFNKSAVYFSSNLLPEDCQTIGGALQVRYLNISDEKYLGLSFFVGRKKRIRFSILCDKMDNKFARWNGENMSEVARSFMIKNVSNAIPIHHMTSFSLPDATIK
ncbi:uncharacterized protein LOC113359551 [Papaver somniferum]|uniref:uncharacterized protein LOC113359551 n=1 Tax=Papaver somniferum TaxID=3469 RepID=UPI000E6F9C22|nr:uncharacterized protein LOC113359551 [Papaver somniferum]